ncbi:MULTISPECIES: DUF1622 domain-containing protein [Streptomyces]|uniref:DUF1622 domain-containing protein n=1 Tax=Streptomyces griseiscabiei TaxID=2993540 RepID=A0ABU4KYN2_9ACTN|nr:MULTISPECIES: DUF1622 domain-containing protein [Streptomyces]MBZ3904362.1 DUF1622 domain-containing protein [Streptomyces griseiscabiei]MDX2908109.1 DUF1622 domain-containing protein [Streptomyces griseiscabiei]
MAGELLPEPLLKETVDTMVRLVEFAGALVILVGALWAFARLLTAGARWGRRTKASPAGAWEPRWEFNRVRLSLGRFLALGLEFQLAGDILRTAVAPTFTEIGQLAAVAAIRTVLNHFLGKEIEHERREVERMPGDGPAVIPAPPS